MRKIHTFYFLAFTFYFAFANTNAYAEPMREWDWHMPGEVYKELEFTDRAQVDRVARVIGMSDNGEAIYQPQVSKAVEAYERFSKKRNADYDLLMATRKNKKGQEDEAGQQDIFSIVEQAQKMDGFYDIEKRPEDAEYKDSE